MALSAVLWNECMVAMCIAVGASERVLMLMLMLMC